MSTLPHEQPSVEPNPVPATFHWHLPSGELIWSDATFRLYGYAPGSVPPSLELVQSHKHPDDLSHFAELIDQVRHDGEPFAFEHRIIAADGVERTIIALVQAELDGNGQVEALTGSSIDVTGVRLEHFAAPDGPVESLVDLVRNLRQAVQSRDLIGQAKGILIERHEISGDEAFELLKFVSQDQNRKLRDIAEYLVRVGEFPGKPSPGRPPHSRHPRAVVSAVPPADERSESAVAEDFAPSSDIDEPAPAESVPPASDIDEPTREGEDGSARPKPGPPKPRPSGAPPRPSPPTG
jgi:hypothetical protein